MFDVVRFWLGKGVDGFRLDMFNSIYKHADFLDNPRSWQFLPMDTPPARFFQQAKYNVDQPENFEFARELRTVCDEFGDRMLLGEVSGPRSRIRQFMGAETNNGLTLVFDFNMLQHSFTAGYFRDLIRDIQVHFPDPFMPVFVFSNHDASRSIHRLGNNATKARLLHLLQLTVRGVPCLYYGEELGMTNAVLPRAAALDPIAHEFRRVPTLLLDRLGITINRDVVRTPMQWDSSKNAGFSASDSTWLPVNPDFRTINVASEAGQPNSLMNTILDLLRIRASEPALHYSGSLQLVEGLPEGILSYLRRWAGDEIAVFLNFTSAPVHLGPRGGRWIAIYRLSPADDFDDGEIVLAPFSGMLLKQVTPSIQREHESARMRTS
jgi:glycosidase